MDIDEKIEFEVEHTALDFKAAQYRKDSTHELLKDIIAMANAFVEGNRYIITGVKKYPDGTFTVNPIPQDEFQDSATYQQLVLNNIEPDLHIDYQPHLYKGNQLVGVFTIPDGSDKPYMIKKLYNSEKGTRKLGESFVRKGTTTTPLMRKDIDRIFEQRIKADTFNHVVACYFSGTNRDKTLNLLPNVPNKLYSQRKADEIKAILTKRENEEKERIATIKQGKLFPKTHLFSMPHLDISTPFFQSTPYEQRSSKTLLENLKSIGETYEEEDHYEVFEKNSARLNITLLNEGSTYLEDATVEVRLPDIEGLYIADKIYRKPVYHNPITALNPPPIRIDHEALSYSRYRKENGGYFFTKRVGDLRHLQPKEIFDIPIRVVIGNKLSGKEIEISITIHGKNLPVPLNNTMIIKIA